MARTSHEFPGVEWVGDAGGFISIDEDACNGCAACVNACMGGCFSMVEKRARVTSLEMCMECGACWFVCTAGAVDFNWPRGGAGYRSDWG